MPEYRRAFRPGGTFFFTIVTLDRRPLFREPANVDRLRSAIRAMGTERPFEFDAGVVLHDHMHFIWTMPAGDSDYSMRIGRMKALFTKALREANAEPPLPAVVGSAHPTSRDRHRESEVWQRRFWEHVIRDRDDYEHHLNYIHYNPVKHGLAACPHEWEASSFSSWVERNVYESKWCCACDCGKIIRPYPEDLDNTVGE